ncbi:hypothetical protein FACS1894201_07510 [Bacteroidia bacterium]|nr:hypothetical protein FACS1894201_07510 [Bacteroidia bacterium]
MSNEKYHNKYRIPSARAKWHDYNGGAYFITVCTKNHEHFFGEIVSHCRDVTCYISTDDEPQMQLTLIGQCLVETLHATSLHNKYAEIPLFVVMPNHFHAIVFIDGKHDNPQCRDVTCYVSTGAGAIKNEKMVKVAKHQSLLSWTIRSIKFAVTKFANENNIEFAWQTRFHDQIIRNQNMMNNVAEYIENNVARWDIDCFNM